jgi:hypothetical protein
VNEILGLMGNGWTAEPMPAGRVEGSVVTVAVTGGSPLELQKPRPRRLSMRKKVEQIEEQMLANSKVVLQELPGMWPKAGMNESSGARGARGR